MAGKILKIDHVASAFSGYREGRHPEGVNSRGGQVRDPGETAELVAILFNRDLMSLGSKMSDHFWLHHLEGDLSL